MYLLYADESGSIDDPNGDFFVLNANNQGYPFPKASL